MAPLPAFQRPNATDPRLTISWAYSRACWRAILWSVPRQVWASIAQSHDGTSTQAWVPGARERVEHAPDPVCEGLPTLLGVRVRVVPRRVGVEAFPGLEGGGDGREVLVSILRGGEEDGGGRCPRLAGDVDLPALDGAEGGQGVRRRGPRVGVVVCWCPCCRIRPSRGAGGVAPGVVLRCHVEGGGEALQLLERLLCCCPLRPYSADDWWRGVVAQAPGVYRCLLVASRAPVGCPRARRRNRCATAAS